jgi:hypothetical protein
MRPRWDLPVFALLALYGLALYWPGRGIGVLSDGWTLLENCSHGWSEVLTKVTAYHSIPVANVLNASLWRLFHLHQTGYQAENLFGIVAVSWAIYLLGVRLFGRGPVPLLASLIFLSNSSFYEVPFWPGVGNLQSVAGLLTVAGVSAALASVKKPGWWAPGLSIVILLAILTYEPAISLAPVAVLAAWAAAAGNEPAGTWRTGLSRCRRAMIAAAFAVAAELALKAYLASGGHPAFFMPTTLDGLRLRLFFAVRACIGIFTLRGSDTVLARIFSLGGAAGYGTPLFHALLALWLVGLATVAVCLLWKAREPAVKLLAAWFALHLTIVSTAIIPVSRHFFLAAIPAALLSAWILWRGCSLAHGWLTRRTSGSLLAERGAAGVLALLLVLIAAAAAKQDLDRAAALNLQASKATKEIQRLVLAHLDARPLLEPALVNMPAIIAADGIGSYSFVNGLHQMLMLTSERRYRLEDVELYHTYDRTVEGVYANASLPISLGDLDQLVLDPQHLVIAFDRSTNTVAELQPSTWQLPSAYTQASAPYLRWQEGDWPWLRVYPDVPLELPVAHAPGSWVALRFLRDSTTGFTLREAGAPVLRLEPSAAVAPSWPVVTARLSGPGPIARLELQPARELWIAGLWSFAPPREYTPRSAPFLPWVIRPEPAMVIEGAVDLPLDASGCGGGCSMTVDYLAETGREVELSGAGEGTHRLTVAPGEAPSWRAASWSVSANGTVVVHVTPRGTQKVMLRALRLGAARAEEKELAAAAGQI